MASNTLGTLLIELKAKTDAFEKGLKSAKDLSFQTSGEIVSSLERIGASLLNLKFNNLDQMGRSLAVVGGIAAATGVALATSLAAVAVKTSKEMVEMGHNAEKAGMGIKEFTENAYAAKRSGVQIEEFTSSMAKLAKTALSAAQGNQQAQRAFQLAGTSATDANGRLRSTGDILADITKKYETTTDRTLKAGLAQQLFGRGGAAIIPMLEKGSQKLEEYRKQAEQFGVAFDENTLSAAKQFRGALAEMKASSEGAAIQFTAGLLPAINQVISGMLKVEGHASLMRSFGETAGDALKFVAKAAMAAYTGFMEMVVAMRSAQETFDKSSWWQKMTGIASAKAIFHVDPKTADEIDALQRRYEKFVDNLNHPPKIQPIKEEKSVGTAGLNPDKENYAAQEIEKLKQKTEGTLALAAAELIGEQSVRATTAAMQADAVILQIATKASKEHKTALQDEIVAAQKKYGATVLNLVTLDQEAARAQSFNKSLKDQTRDLGISADAHQRLTEAAKRGNAAVGEAIVQNQVEAALKKADIQLTDEQKKKVQEWTEAIRQNTAAQIQEDLQNRIKAAQDSVKESRAMIVAQREGREAEIQAQAALEVTNFEISHHTQLTREDRLAMEDAIAKQIRLSDAQRTASEVLRNYDPQGEYEKKLHDISDAQLEGGITGVQAAMAVRDAYLELQKQIDQLLLKTQTFSGGAAAAIRQFGREAQDMAQVTYNAFTQLFNGISRQLAQLVVTGKASFSAIVKEFNQTIAEGLIKKYLTGPLFTKIGEKLGLPGLGKQPGETQSNPLWIRDADKHQPLKNAAGGAGSSLGELSTIWSTDSSSGVVGGIVTGILGGILGFNKQSNSLTPDGTQGNPFYVYVQNQGQGGEGAGSGGGGFNLANLVGSLFGFGSSSGPGGDAGYATDSGGANSGFPFLAGGGPVSPGNAYWVGDKGIELFTPDRPGYVHSNDSIREALGNGAGGGPVINFNVTTPSADSFKKSQRQLSYEALLTASRFATRN